MQYLGGKKHLAKHIAAVLESRRSDGQRFVDVFCGSLAITAAMSDRGPRLANDGCAPLIRLYEAWRDGWRPPVITESVYQAVKTKQDPTDPLTAFVGFGCSYGGKWFGGFARDPEHGRDFAATAARSLDKLVQSSVTLSCCDFSGVGVNAGDLVYGDSPYRGTTKYGYYRGFDYPAYLTQLNTWSRSADVFVSEYETQSENWEQVAEWDVRKSRFKGRQVERLYRVHPVSSISQ
jgi:DNA adenine methylase